ncbi:MAG: hypothetical protein AABY22_06705 [Nanoarchaeota archaeon]
MKNLRILIIVALIIWVSIMLNKIGDLQRALKQEIKNRQFLQQEMLLRYDICMRYYEDDWICNPTKNVRDQFLKNL